MIKPIIYLQLRVGTTAGLPEDIKHVFTVERIRKIIKEKFENFTLIETDGQWAKEKEPGALIDTIMVIDPELTSSQIFSLCQQIHQDIKVLLKEMLQRSILVMVRVSIGRREISWMRLVGWDGENLVDPPFPFASLLVRKIKPEARIDFPRLYSLIADYCSKKIPSAVEVYQGVPAFCFHVETPIPLELAGPGNSEQMRRDWDESILNWDNHILYFDRYPPNIPIEILSKFERNSDYIGVFQQISFGDKSYYATDIPKALSSYPISVSECSYYQGIGCCEASNLKLLDLWLEYKLDGKKMGESLEKELGLDHLYETPYPMVGMEVVTLTPDDHILRKKRSQDVGAFPGAYGLIPSGMVEPVPGCKHPSVYYSFLRELDEEMFRGPKKGETVNSLLKRPHIKDLTGELFYLGHCFNLLNRFVVICLLFKPSEDWWGKYEGKIYPNWEYAAGSTDPVPINEAWEHAYADPSDYTPGAYAALKFADEYLDIRCLRL